jgi:hypothetical protein
MATWADLKETRLKICDPQDVIDLSSVANEGARPPLPAAQTAYLILDKAEYQIYSTGLAAWARVDLEISDSRLSALIDAYGVKLAAAKAIGLILVAMGKRLTIARTQSGADSIDFVNLTTAYNFYKALSDSFTEEASVDEGVSGGGYFRMPRPRIGGGME